VTVSELRRAITDSLARPNEPDGEADAPLSQFRHTDGDEGEAARGKLLRLGAAARLFAELYGDGAVGVWRAPARVNILGEHVDYVSWLPTAALPFASREHGMLMLCRANEGGRVRGASTLAACEPFEIEVGDGLPGAGDWTARLYARPTPAPHWSNYVSGAVHFARMKYGGRAGRGFDFVVDADIPAGGGASSSSALTVLAGAAIRRVNGIEIEPAELAEDSAQAEWYAGTRGGAMDHTTICLARRHSAVHIDFAARRASLVPLPGGRYRWVTFFTHKADKGREVMLEYNERAAVARLLIPALLERRGIEHAEEAPDALPEAVTLAEVERQFPHAYRECQRAFPALIAERRHCALKVRDRARHHLGEVRRVAEAVRLLAAAGGRGDDATMSALGGLLNESHASLRDCYEVSTTAVERLIEVLSMDARVLGARLMGGGFGGNVLALTADEHARGLIDRVQREYYGPRRRDARREGAVMVSTPGDGLSALVA
jgi:galactokinase